jgi:hypothetical protein
MFTALWLRADADGAAVRGLAGRDRFYLFFSALFRAFARSLFRSQAHFTGCL